MIVVDTNIIAYLLIRGEYTRQVRKLHATDREWLVPTLWRHEFLNVLATYARSGGVSLDDAQQIWEESNRLFVSRERPVSWRRALSVAVQHNVSAYDAQFITLAQTLQTLLVTEDKHLQKQFEFAVSTQQFLASADF